MEQDVIQEEQRRLERYVLLIYFSYAVFLTLIAQQHIWAVWLAIVIDLSWLAVLYIYISKTQTYHFRAFFTAGLMQINLVIWSVYVDHFAMIVPAVSAITVVLGLYSIPNIIWQTFVTATFLNVYYLLRLLKANIFFGETAIQTVLEIISVYMVQYAMFLLLQKRQETAEQQLEKIASLQASQRDKDDFMANVSHEIRTPIHTICGMSEIMLREQLNGQLRKDVQEIQAAGRRLQSIVSDVSDFSQLQYGKVELAQEQYNISTTIYDVINQSVVRKKERDLELIIDCSADMPCGMVGDEQKIRRVIMNIVDNALKFTTDGCVYLLLYTRDTSYGVNLIVQVKDTGIGMKTEHLEKLFDRFSQADTRRSRQQGGIGLGLAISQAIVEKMGGFITVESEYGIGTTVQFTIPQKVTDHTPIAVIQHPERIHALVYMNVEQFSHTKIRDAYSYSIQHIIEQLHLKCQICQNMTQVKQKVERENFTHIFISIAEYEQDREYFDDLAEYGQVIALLDRKEDEKIKNANIVRIYKPLFLLTVIDILNKNQPWTQQQEYRYDSYGNLTAPKVRVLVVDDNLTNIRVMEGLLAPYQIKVSAAASGAEALDKVDTMAYDAVFMDHMMPQMDGIEALHRIRQKPGNYFKNLPVIALTANAVEGMREVFLAEGFQDFLSKPVELSVLERVLKRNLPQEKLNFVKQPQPAQADRQAQIQHSHLDNKKHTQMRYNYHTQKDDTFLPPEYLNETAGITYCGGLQNYIEVLHMTRMSGQTEKEKIQRCFDTKNWKEYTIYVHALKSSMTNIGAEELARMAKELEYAGKQGDFAYIEKNHDDMMMEYAQILTILKDAFLPEDVDKPKGTAAAEPLQSKGTQIDLYGMPQSWQLDQATLVRAAEEFESAAMTFDEDKMYAIAQYLAKCSYMGRRLETDMKTVMRKISMSDYLSASDAVASLKEKKNIQG